MPSRDWASSLLSASRPSLLRFPPPGPCDRAARVAGSRGCWGVRATNRTRWGRVDAPRDSRWVPPPWPRLLARRGISAVVVVVATRVKKRVFTSTYLLVSTDHLTRRPQPVNCVELVPRARGCQEVCLAEEEDAPLASGLSAVRTQAERLRVPSDRGGGRSRSSSPTAAAGRPTAGSDDCATRPEPEGLHFPRMAFQLKNDISACQEQQ